MLLQMSAMIPQRQTGKTGAGCVSVYNDLCVNTYMCAMITQS